METKKLLQYLSIVVELEKNKYVQEQTLKKLDGNIQAHKTEYNKNNALNARAFPDLSAENIKVNESEEICQGVFSFFIKFFYNLKAYHF